MYNYFNSIKNLIYYNLIFKFIIKVEISKFWFKIILNVNIIIRILVNSQCINKTLVLINAKNKYKMI
jgi:hypothetical protein